MPFLYNIFTSFCVGTFYLHLGLSNSLLPLLVVFLFNIGINTSLWAFTVEKNEMWVTMENDFLFCHPYYVVSPLPVNVE